MRFNKKNAYEYIHFDKYIVYNDMLYWILFK